MVPFPHLPDTRHGSLLILLPEQQSKLPAHYYESGHLAISISLLVFMDSKSSTMRESCSNQRWKIASYVPQRTHDEEEQCYLYLFTTSLVICLVL